MSKSIKIDSINSKAIQFNQFKRELCIKEEQNGVHNDEEWYESTNAGIRLL